MDDASYRLLADLFLFAHVTFVGFVIVGLLMILIGGACGWSWIRNPWFRVMHLVSIAVVIVQAWLGVICPLTTFEMYFREKAGEATYQGAFIAYWLQNLLYYEAPAWVFAVCYTLFGLAVVASWVKFRPRPFCSSASRA